MLVSDGDVVAAEAFEIADAGETSGSVVADTIGLPAVRVGVGGVAVPSTDGGMISCGKKGGALEAVDVEVALELELGASCDAPSSAEVWLLEISSADVATAAKLAGSVGTDVSLGVSEVFAFTGTGAAKAL
jgi:hypothetical protein